MKKEPQGLTQKVKFLVIFHWFLMNENSIGNIFALSEPDVQG